MNTVYVFWLRQIKKYFRSPARIVGSLGQPILFLVALGYGFGAIYAKAGGGNYFEFLVPGVISMSILFRSVFSGIDVIWDRQFGFLKETLVAPVSRFTIMFGRTLGGATEATIQGGIVLVLALIFGFHLTTPQVAMLPVAVLMMFLLALLFTALGTAIGSVLRDLQGFQLIVNFLLMPLFFLSGALFPVDQLPSALAIVVNLNPLSYGIDGIRGLLGGAIHYSLLTDFIVLIVATVICLLAGAYLFSKIEA